MTFILALIPILLILFLMVGLHWSTARAGAAGYLAGFLLSLLFFGGNVELLAYAHAKAFLFSLDVLLIIWAAFLLYRVVDEAGAIRTIGLALPHLTPDRGLQALVIGWVFASFLQGVGGFGVPVAVTAPLLVGIGLPPLAAVVVPSLGHGWAVTFGSMGSSFQALMSASGLPQEVLGMPAAIMLGMTSPIIGIMIAHFLEGWAGVRRMLVPILAWGLLMGCAQVLIVSAGFWNIASFLSGVMGLLITPLVVGKRLSMQNAKSIIGRNRPLLIALSGYLIVILVTILVQLIPAIKDFLSPVVIRVSFPEIQSSTGFITPAGDGRKINIFAHTGSLLFYSSVLAYLVYRAAGLYQPGSVQRILNGTLQRVLSSSVSIFSMISLAIIMEHSGMTQTLAKGLATGFGGVYPLIAPWIGAIGAFITGSNTNANVMFAALQMQTAKLLGYSEAVILAAQTAGAALASVAAPAKVVVGCSTAGMSGKEGEVLRRLGLYVGILVLLVCFMAFAATLL